jgi:hypothetical protein
MVAVAKGDDQMLRHMTLAHPQPQMGAFLDHLEAQPRTARPERLLTRYVHHGYKLVHPTSAGGSATRPRKTDGNKVKKETIRARFRDLFGMLGSMHAGARSILALVSCHGGQTIH